jgi:hypothetical protein
MAPPFGEHSLMSPILDKRESTAAAVISFVADRVNIARRQKQDARKGW